MPRKASATQRGYGWAYQKARARLLASNPPCHWCGAPATTADHLPPIEEVGHPHLSLVPACGPCNFGHKAKRASRYPGPSRDW